MRPIKPGVEVRECSIRIIFRYQGTQHREALRLDSAALPPTPANIKYAKRLAAEIGDKIRLGIFKYAEYFPDSSHARQDTTEKGVPLLFDVMDRFLRVHDLKGSTRALYKRRITHFWKVQLKNVPINQVLYSDILEALANGTWKSAKSRNNELHIINGVFELARIDKHIAENPCVAIEAKKYQKKKPDPFSLEEARLIVAHLKEQRPEQTYNFVELMFFSGLRTSEGIGLQWSCIDFRKKEMLIEGGNVYDEETDTTKTSQARVVKLNKIALAALQRQKAHTYLAGGHVFHDPKTDEPWKYRTITDVRGFWEMALKKLGIRYRRPYNMRHTYATIGLMSGAKPAFLAGQLGHSLRVFFEVYAKWLSSSDDEAEMAKVDDAIGQKTQNKPKTDFRPENEPRTDE